MKRVLAALSRHVFSPIISCADSIIVKQPNLLYIPGKSGAAVGTVDAPYPELRDISIRGHL